MVVWSPLEVGTGEKACERGRIDTLSRSIILTQEKGMKGKTDWWRSNSPTPDSNILFFLSFIYGFTNIIL